MIFFLFYLLLQFSEKRNRYKNVIAFLFFNTAFFSFLARHINRLSGDSVFLTRKKTQLLPDEKCFEAKDRNRAVCEIASLVKSITSHTAFLKSMSAGTLIYLRRTNIKLKVVPIRVLRLCNFAIVYIESYR